MVYANTQLYSKWNNGYNPFNIISIWSELKLSENNSLNTNIANSSYVSFIISGDSNKQIYIILFRTGWSFFDGESECCHYE